MAILNLYMRARRRRNSRGIASIVRAATFALSMAAATADAGVPAETIKCLSSILSGEDATPRRSSITDQYDRPVASDRCVGRSALVTLIPRDCDTACAMRLVDIDRVARALPRDLSARVAIVAIDAGHRSAGDLRTLMMTWRLKATGWTLLRGDVEAARRRLDVIPAGLAEPSNVVALFDASGALRQRYSGAPLDRERIAREVAVIDTLSRDAPASACSVLSPAKSPS